MLTKSSYSMCCEIRLWVKCRPAGRGVQVRQRVKCGGEVRGTARILPTCSVIAKANVGGQ